MIVDVEHNAARHRYEVLADGHLAGFVTYRVEDDEVLFTHTAIDQAYRGRGLAHQLVRHALAETRGEGKTPVGVCPFVAGVLAREPSLVP